ncbi:MAG: DUF2189 domain-containing protein [Rhizobiales bacterium]|nr:DUF2189 domain-containing protein [Hyphomicrobiales bacterium]
MTSAALADVHAVRFAIRKIHLSDLKAALRSGLEDFKAMPSHLAFLVAIYPLATLIAAMAAARSELLPLVFPLLSGFALIGPLVAIGLYEISRRRELGLRVTWDDAFRVLRSPSIGPILAVSVLLGLIYVLWLAVAFAIYFALFGGTFPSSAAEFIAQVFTTGRGWMLIVIGCGVGFLFAVVVLAMAAVSFPMLIDRNVEANTAIRTSVRAFRENPVPMLTWGAIVAGLLIAGALPLLVGLAVVLPVLGHATWHLYRKLVAD